MSNQAQICDTVSPCDLQNQQTATDWTSC